MKGLVVFYILLLVSYYPKGLLAEVPSKEPSYLLNGLSVKEIDSLYTIIISKGPKFSYSIFSRGLSGYYKLLKDEKIQNTRYLTLIDFSISSREKRLWVIDLETDSTVHYSLVAHGKNTGNEYAVKFSNKPKSNMSSLGFYITGSTYYGKHGLSLWLEGVEKGINDNAPNRAIVMHPASYVSHDFVRRYGRAR